MPKRSASGRGNGAKARHELARMVDGYLDAVSGGRRVVGNCERLAVQRHIRDLARADGQSLRFDEGCALDVLLFAEQFVRHTKGEWGGRPFRFCEQSAWIAFVLWSIFGWQKWNGTKWVRRYRTAYVSVARKNGKTYLCAALALYMLAFDGEAGAEVYFAATHRDQARRGWEQASQIVSRATDDEFKRIFTIIDSRSRICTDTEDVCVALGRDSNSMDGLNPSCGIVDELHEHKTRGTWDVIESGMGAREQPLMVGITTAGSVRQGICWDLDHDSVRVLEGVIEDDSLFAYIARPDDGDDWADPATWQKANPNLGVSVKLDKLEIACDKAKNNISWLNEFRRKHCNEWTEANTAWLALDKWDACGNAVNSTALEGAPCFAGLDLSSSGDVTALSLVFPPKDGETVFDVLPSFWIPGDNIPARVRLDRVPFDAWVHQGHVFATEGNVVDQDAIKMHLVNLRERYDIREVVMDPWNGVKLATELQGLGFTVVNFRQGYASMSPAMKETEKLILTARLRHGGNPVLRWMFRNVSVKTDPAGNIKPDKSRSADRIDGIVATVMAVGRAVATLAAPEPQMYVFGADEAKA